MKFERSSTHIGEAFTTPYMATLVRLLARMCPIMDSQGALLNKTLPTPVNRAPVWPFVGVDAKVSLQIRFSVETLYSVSP